MKRFWIGICILALLLAGSAAICVGMQRVHAPIAAQLSQAAEAALSGDPESAEALFYRANARWEKYHRFTAAFADHTPMDEMDTLLEEAEVYAAAQEQPHFAAVCAHLSVLAAAIADSHTLSWWNLL